MSKKKMANVDRLTHYLKNHSKLFPKLVPALNKLTDFVGHDDIKETVSKMVLYFIAQFSKQPRRSKRKRKSVQRKIKRRRTFSNVTSDDEDDGDGGKTA